MLEKALDSITDKVHKTPPDEVKVRSPTVTVFYIHVGFLVPTSTFTCTVVSWGSVNISHDFGLHECLPGTLYIILDPYS